MKEIEKFNPCSEAMEFRNKFDTFEEAWNACPRGDWMLWISQKLDVDIRVLTLAKGYCANTVIKLMKDERSKNAVKAAIKFGKGLIELSELNAAAYAAYAAADVRIKNQKETANICRKYLTKTVMEKIKLLEETE